MSGRRLCLFWETRPVGFSPTFPTGLQVLVSRPDESYSFAEKPITASGNINGKGWDAIPKPQENLAIHKPSESNPGSPTKDPGRVLPPFSPFFGRSPGQPKPGWFAKCAPGLRVYGLAWPLNATVFRLLATKMSQIASVFSYQNLTFTPP